MDQVLLIDQPADGVMLLTLNRPQQRNALDLTLLEALRDAFADLRDNPRWRCAVLTGNGPAFCAGLDLKTFSAPDAPRHLAGETIRAIAGLPKPIIAAVNGAAYTGGLEAALGCDFIIAAEEARFADTHAKIGALSGSGMSARLPRAVGAAFARQMMLTCLPVDAATALRVGLVNEVVPADRLVPRALELAGGIAGNDPELVQIVKNVVDQGTRATLADALRLEAEALAARKAAGDMNWNTAR